MHVYLDCDEVLLRTAEFHHLMRKNNYNIESDDITKYPSQWKYEHPDLVNYQVSTDRFIKSYEFSGVEAVKNAIKGVEKLRQANFHLHVVTSITDDRLSAVYREKNLQYVFGQAFDDVTCLPLGHDNKKQYYQKAEKGIVIDDSAHNILDAVECGHQGIFIAIEQNKDWHRQMRENPKICVKKDLLDAANYIIAQNLYLYADKNRGYRK